jgi:hypothetical protein
MAWPPTESAMEAQMAKGQKKSNREAKKPKKTEAEKLKSKPPLAGIPTFGAKAPPKKA